MRIEQMESRKYPGCPLRGFWNKREALIRTPCVSRPDLVDERNRTTDRTARGKRNKFQRERRDCGVRALAICANIPYTRALDLLASRGRKSGGTTYTRMILRVLRDMNYLIAEVYAESLTLVTLERELKRGIYLVYSTNHFTALVNGVVWDGWRYSRKRVITVFEIEPNKTGFMTA